MQICQLYEIFQLIGTPDDSVWPEVTSLPNWQPLFPKWQPKSLSEVRKIKNTHLDYSLLQSTPTSFLQNKDNSSSICFEFLIYTLYLTHNSYFLRKRSVLMAV